MAKIPICESSKKKVANCPSQVSKSSATNGFFFPLNRLRSRDFRNSVPRPQRRNFPLEQALKRKKIAEGPRPRVKKKGHRDGGIHGIHGHLGIVMIHELRVQSDQKNGASMFFLLKFQYVSIWWVFFPSKLQKSPEVQIHGIVWSLNPERKNCCHRLWKMRWSFWACRGGLR